LSKYAENPEIRKIRRAIPGVWPEPFKSDLKAQKSGPKSMKPAEFRATRPGVLEIGPKTVGILYFISFKSLKSLNSGQKSLKSLKFDLKSGVLYKPQKGVAVAPRENLWAPVNN